jgi:hypothetical protein
LRLKGTRYWLEFANPLPLSTSLVVVQIVILGCSTPH